MRTVLCSRPHKYACLSILALLNAQAVPSFEAPPLVVKYARRLVESPNDVSARNRFRVAVSRSGLAFWEYAPTIPVRYSKEAKTVLIDQKALNSGSPERLAAWMVHAITDGLDDAAVESAGAKIAAWSALPKALHRDVARKSAAALIWKAAVEKNPELHQPELDFLVLLETNGQLPYLAYFESLQDEPDQIIREWAVANADKLLKFLVTRHVYSPEKPPGYVVKVRTEDETPTHNSSFSGPMFDELKELTDFVAKLEAQIKEEKGPLGVALLQAELATALQGLGRDAEAIQALREAEAAGQELPRLSGFLAAVSAIVTWRSAADEAKLEAAVESMAVGAPSLRARVLRLAGREAERKNRNLSALSLYERLYAISQADNDTESMRLAGEGIRRRYNSLFDSICWNHDTGRIRDCSPTDFTNDGSLDPGGKNYGMRSAEEDLATFATAYSMQPYREESKEIYWLNRIAREELKKGNPVLALKCLYMEYLDSIRDALQLKFLSRTAGTTILQGVRINDNRFTVGRIAYRHGDPSLYIGLLKQVGVFLEEDSVEMKFAPPPGDALALTVDEVEAAIGQARDSGIYIPARFTAFLELVRHVQKFQRKNQLEVRQLIEEAKKKL